MEGDSYPDLLPGQQKIITWFFKVDQSTLSSYGLGEAIVELLSIAIARDQYPTKVGENNFQSLAEISIYLQSLR